MRKHPLLCWLVLILAITLLNPGCGSSNNKDEYMFGTGTGTGSNTDTGTGSGTATGTSTYTGPSTPGPTGTGTIAISKTWYAYAVPSSHDSTTPTPLFVFLHGGGTDGANVLPHAELVASGKNILFIGPNSTGSELYGRTMIQSWDWDGDADNIMACIKDAMDTWYVDPNRIYVFGHSLGAAMNVVFCSGPDGDNIAAMACCCASWPWPNASYLGTANRLVPALFTSQTGDPNYTATQDLQNIFNTYGHTTTFQDDSGRLTGHTFDYQKMMDAYDWMSTFTLN